MADPSASDHCGALVRSDDRDRYYATLFAPADRRPHIFALYAFAAEIARVREQVTNPLPGEIRLQWWRDALTSPSAGEASAHPVASALDETIRRFGLPRQALINVIDAHEFDLYDDPMPAQADLDGYLGETSSVLSQLVALILAGSEAARASDATGHAGLAIGLTDLLRALPWHARQGRLYLPRDMLERHGVTRDDVVLGRGGPGFLAALAEMRDLARHHLARAKALLVDVPPAARPALLPLALVPGYLAEMERTGYDPFTSRIERPAWRVILALWRASR